MLAKNAKILQHAKLPGHEARGQTRTPPIYFYVHAPAHLPRRSNLTEEARNRCRLWNMRGT